MNQIEIGKAVLGAYARKYPKWVDVEVGAITKAAAGGFLVVVSTRTEEEVCYVDQKGNVRIFDATGELVTYLENLGSWRRWIFSGQGVSAIAFFMLLSAVIVCTFVPLIAMNKDVKLDNDAFGVLRQMLVLAAGFFFGNQTKREAD